jgi:hypothetical protein
MTTGLTRRRRLNTQAYSANDPAAFIYGPILPDLATYTLPIPDFGPPLSMSVAARPSGDLLSLSVQEYDTMMNDWTLQSRTDTFHGMYNILTSNNDTCLTIRVIYHQALARLVYQALGHVSNTTSNHFPTRLYLHPHPGSSPGASTQW